MSGVEPPPHRGELLGHREPPDQVARRLAQDRGEAGREPRGVLHLGGGDVEGIGAGGDREGLPAAVQDRPALGTERHRLGVLVLGQPRVLVVLEDLQVGQPAEQDDEGTGQARREDQRPASEALGPQLGHGVTLSDPTAPGSPARQLRAPVERRGAAAALDELAGEAHLVAARGDHPELAAGLALDAGERLRAWPSRPAAAGSSPPSRRAPAGARRGGRDRRTCCTRSPTTPSTRAPRGPARRRAVEHGAEPAPSRPGAAGTASG